MAIFLKNALYCDYKTFHLTYTHIKVNTDNNNPVEFLGDMNPLPLKNDDTLIDCSGKIVMHSLACGHHHAYSALARGMGGPLKPPANFPENLKYLWWALDKSLDKDAVEASAYATAIACAKNGITFIIDHHASPYFVQGSLETLAKVFDKVGISHLLCYEISDRDGEKVLNDGFDATEEYLKLNQGLVGLHASFTVSSHTLERAVALAEKYNSGIHIHTAEDICDQNNAITNYNKRVVERLNDAGVLMFPKTILVHCLHLSENERNIISKSPVYIAQNIESNLNNNVGSFIGHGLNQNIMLGTDGMHSNMLRSLKAAYIYGQTSEKISMNDAYNRLIKTHEYILKNKFIGNADNNLIVIDYQSPTILNTENFLAHFIFGIEPSDIQYVIANGKLIVKDRKIISVDEDECLKFTQDVSAALWKRFKNQKV